MRASIDFLQRGPKTLMVKRVELLANATRPRIVKSQPLPMASMIGAVTKDPTHEKMFRIKLFSATPADAFCGINSVNIVVAMPNIIMEPTPKKKLAIIYYTHPKLASKTLLTIHQCFQPTGASQKTPLPAVHPYQIKPAG